jgi:tyrosyl-tRNA synthetase
MKVPDHVLPAYFQLTTDLPDSVYNRLLSGDIRQAHFAYAREIVRLYRGADAIEQAEGRYISIAAGNAPDTMESFAVSGKEMAVVALLRFVGFAGSNSEARRLIEGGGVKIDGEIIRDIDASLSRSAVISRGKNRFAKVAFM